MPALTKTIADGAFRNIQVEDGDGADRGARFNVLKECEPFVGWRDQLVVIPSSLIITWRARDISRA